MTITGPSGRRYQVELIADRDTDGRIIDINLEIHPAAHPQGRNLLEPAGRWHGMAPYEFIAADLMNGGAKSIYGRARTIPIQGANASLRVSVEDGSVSPSGSPDFLSLKLIVVPGRATYPR